MPLSSPSSLLLNVRGQIVAYWEEIKKIELVSYCIRATVIEDLTLFKWCVCLNLRCPPLCIRVLRSSGMLRSVDRYLVTEVSGQLLSPFFKGLAVDRLPSKMGPIGCPETSVNKYKSMLRGMQEERRFCCFSSSLYFFHIPKKHAKGTSHKV